MSKNIVICCDGTGNEISENISNVLKLYRALRKTRKTSLPTEALRAKFPRWKENYRNARVQTSIPRISRGNPDEITMEFQRAHNAPDAIRRVCIVTSSLSRAAVKSELLKIATGQTPNPYFVQLYWLLLSFFSACTEMNAHGYVICQE